MEEERNNTVALKKKKDADSDRFKNILAHLASWFSSNFFALAFPVGAVWLVNQFNSQRNFDLRESYTEMLMITISICMNLVIELNSKEYDIEEGKQVLLRIIAVGLLVFASLAYGISKTTPEVHLIVDTVFIFSCAVFVLAFIIGLICEYFKKWRN